MMCVWYFHLRLLCGEHSLCPVLFFSGLLVSLMSVQAVSLSSFLFPSLSLCPSHFWSTCQGSDVKGVLCRVIVFQCLEGHAQRHVCMCVQCERNPTSFRQEQRMRETEGSQWSAGEGWWWGI